MSKIEIKDPENTLRLDLSTGTVFIELRPDVAPGHCARLKELAREGFYNDTVFHRVIPGFMAQGGDPDGNGYGGSGTKLKAEFNDMPHVRGTASMARGPSKDSGDSQFFICFDDARFLDGDYTAWGQVIDGMEAVDALERGEPPVNPSKLISMKVVADL